MAKTLQKYILALAQQVATDQGRPLIISTLVGRLHRRLQKEKEVPKEAKEEGNESSDEEEQPLVIADTSSDEDKAKVEKRLTRAQKKKSVSATYLMCT